MTTQQKLGLILIVIGIVLLLLDNGTQQPPPKASVKSKPENEVDFNEFMGRKSAS